MNARELRKTYLAFFKSKGHDEYPSGSLVPHDVTGRLDESLLFTGAGMVQFKPYFLGTSDPPSKRLMNVQKCMRTGDIDEVGNLNHLTFFEMLGNFSFGDYYKADAIAYSWEFMTSPEWLALDPARLCFTVFETDDESYDLWAGHLKKAGLDPSRRIFRLGEEKNYWPAGAFSSGPPGPCGPNTEMFYWVPSDNPPRGRYKVKDFLKDEEAGKWLEIWNDVFITSDWQGTLRDPSRPDKGYEKTGLPDLPFQSVDTGMGLERTACVLGGFSSVYETDVFTPIISAIESCSPSSCTGGGGGQGVEVKYGDDETTDVAIRIIADHLRAAAFCIAEGVLPSNTGRGYVLRRLIRRAVLKGVRVLGFDEPFLHRCYDGVVSALGDHYVELHDRKAVVVETLKNEEEQFRRTLDEGQDIFNIHLTGLLWDPLQTFVKLLDKHSELAKPVDKKLIEAYNLVSGTALEEGKPGNIIRELQNLWHILDGPTGFAHLREAMKATLSMQALPNEGRELLTSLDLFVYKGDDAFELASTHGFPIEITAELCKEIDVSVDMDGYWMCVEDDREMSRKSSGMDTVYGDVSANADGELQVDTRHSLPIYYSTDNSSSRIVAVRPFAGVPTVSGFKILLDQTPFYPESGGQVTDTGYLGSGKVGVYIWKVERQDDQIWHWSLGLVNPLDRKRLDAKLEAGYIVPPEEELLDVSPELQTWRVDDVDESRKELERLLLGKKVHAVVDIVRRTAITRNHTATHLMHAALRKVLGDHVTQAGSLVDDKHLRFDFTHGKAMTADEIAKVEGIVNEEVLKAQPVKTYDDIALQEARDMGAMALFGEKYADRVRVVQIGEMPPAEKSFSRELCGGIHVKNTGEIGMFKIVSEASAASGVRRIEAVTGHGAIDWANQQHETIEQAARLVKSQPAELLTSVEKVLQSLKEEKLKRQRMAQQGAGSQDQIEQVGSVQLAVGKLEEADPKDAQIVADRLTDGKPDRVALVVLVSGGKLTFVCKVGEAAREAGAHAGNLIREVAKVAGGGGGGRADFATAGGRDAGKIDEAIARCREVLAEQVG